MDKNLLNIKKINLPEKIILIPFFIDKNYLQAEIKRAKKVINIMGAQLIFFELYCLVTGFIGYSCLLTLIEFINNFKDKDVYFLGTCGCLSSDKNESELLTVDRIYASSVFNYFTKNQVLSLTPLMPEKIKTVKAVSVDIIQRETKSWLLKQQRKKIYCVEMELFPLRWFLKKNFSALLISTDRVTKEGVKRYEDLKLTKLVFKKALNIIKELCSDEKKSNPE